MKTTEEIEILKADALSGDNIAQNSLGCVFASGDGVTKNLATAFYWFEKSAKSGNKYAQYNTGLYYHNGYGVPKDIQKAIEYYELAACQGYGKAANALGDIYEHGYTTKDIDRTIKHEKYAHIIANPQEAFYWYTNGAHSENIAIFNLARCYEQGIGTEINLRKACFLYRASNATGWEERLSAILKNYNPITDMPLSSCVLIVNNPFHILGLWSNSSDRVLKANQSKLEALSRVGKHASLDSDTILPTSVSDYSDIYSNRINYYLNNHRIAPKFLIDVLYFAERYNDPSVSVIPARSLDMISDAASDLASPKTKIKYSLFWFFNKTKEDSCAIQLLTERKWNEAVDVWESTANFSSQINLATLSILDRDFNSAIERILCVIHNEKYRDEFISTVCPPNIAFGEDELSHIFMDALYELPSTELSVVDIFQAVIASKNATTNDIEYNKQKAFDSLKSTLVSALDYAENQDRTDFDLSREAYYKVAHIAPYQVKFIGRVIGKSFYQYKLFCNEIAKKLLEFSIYYNNKNDHWGAPSTALYFAQTAKDIALDETLIDRCAHNIKIFAENKKISTVEQIMKSIEDALSSDSSGKSVSSIEKLYDKLDLYIACLKTELGQDDEQYKRVADRIANTILNMVIDLYNSGSNEDSVTITSIEKLLTKMQKQTMSESTKSRLNKNLLIISRNKKVTAYNRFASIRDILENDRQLHKNDKQPEAPNIPKGVTKQRRIHKLIATAISALIFSGICWYLNLPYIWSYYSDVAPWWLSVCVVFNILIVLFVIEMWCLELTRNPYNYKFAWTKQIIDDFFNVIKSDGNETGPFALPLALLYLVLLFVILIVWIIGFIIKAIAYLATLIK
jgi:hypothetical protein